MGRRRLHRLTTALFAVLSLLFSQWALAQYVCPQQADVQAMADQPALCHQHAADQAQSFEPAKLPTAGQPAAVQVFELPLQLEARRAVAAPASASFEAQPPPDPVFLSTRRLRV
jgi:hypothetical protein